MIGKSLVTALTVSLAFTAFSATIYADESETGGSTWSGKGTIEINYKCDDTALEGANISIYKIADAVLTDDTICYSLIEELSAYSVQNKFGRETFFDGMTAAESNGIAKELSKEKLVAEYVSVTDKDGYCRFEGAAYGMYLVKQTGSEGVSADYTAFDPFLLSVPIVDEESSGYIFNVQTMPKSEVYRVPETTETETTPSGTTPMETTTPGSPILGIEDNSEALSMIFAGTAAGCGLMVAALTLGSFIDKNKKKEK